MITLKEIHIFRFMKFKGSQTDLIQKTASHRHIIIKLPNKKKKNESSKRIVTCYIQGNIHSANRRLLSRNHTAPENGMIYSKCKKKKKNCQPTILYLAKLFFRNEGEILSQTNKSNDEVHHHYTCLTRNAKGI